MKKVCKPAALNKYLHGRNDNRWFRSNRQRVQGRQGAKLVGQDLGEGGGVKCDKCIVIILDDINTVVIIYL